VDDLSNMQITLDKSYFATFSTKNGEKYGLRLGEPDDAHQLNQIFYEIYEYNYVDPEVYDISKLKKHIASDKTYWFIGEKFESTKTIMVGAGLMEISNYYTSIAEKLVIRPDYRGLGLASEMGALGILNILKLPAFKNILRLNAESRAESKGAQAIMENTGGTAFGFNPIYATWGDRRILNGKSKKPYVKGDPIPVIFYVRPINKFWKKRHSVVYLLNDEDVFYFYDYIIKNNRKMKKYDLSIMMGDSKIKWHNMRIYENKSFGSVHLEGCIHDIMLKMYLKKYSKWRYIDWRIPTTEQGIHSMKLAKDNGFKVIGYDFGSIVDPNGNLTDSVLYAYIPKKIKVSTFDTLDVIKKCKPLVNRVLDSLNN
jgi:RimJ/RimL family protein N-acetyltransferase